ncbi:DUF4834 family protein [Robiginitalea sp. IMCC43444]|uniref:DUF4834 family protein n=1 Tax=Robiginitalea sp. IMCC43444 TaxID=3459121 RepID=UPI0040416CE4
MGILRTILFIILGYYLLKILGRIFQPWIHAYAVRKTESYFNTTFQSRDKGPLKDEKVGEVSIDKPPVKTRKTNSDVGEYIDFEEIE